MLKIADHAEVSGRRRIDARFHPITGRGHRSRRFEQHGKLRRFGVLRLIENDAHLFFANARRCDWMLQQFFRQRDLISVRNESALESKIEKIALHFCRNTGCGVVYPFAQRRKFLSPKLCKLRVVRRETNRPTQVFPIARITFFPLAQFRLRLADAVAAHLIGLRVNLGEIERRAWR